MVNVSPLWKYSLISDVTVVVFLKSLGSDFAIEALMSSISAFWRKNVKA